MAKASEEDDSVEGRGPVHLYDNDEFDFLLTPEPTRFAFRCY